MIRILQHDKAEVLAKYTKIIEEVSLVNYTGRVDRIVGLTIESVGPAVHFGELCKIRMANREYLHAEVVGFHKNRVILMPIGDMKGIVPGAEVIAAGSSLMVPVGPELLGRVISGTGKPLDSKGEVFTEARYPVQGHPLNPLQRRIIREPLSVGIRAIDGLNTVGKGQRIGIFSGSGVGKSTLLAMMARYTNADVNVIALIGERGREVRDFVEKELGVEGLKRSVVVVATSDQPPMMRIRGAYLAHAIAEYFRDQGKDVNLMMDSVTRFALAQREVGLAAGEPSATRGFPPSVFSLLPRLLERSGTREGAGSITGFYTILVEADDMNEPIADAVRGILDGHIVLARNLAHKGHYPAVDVLGSISRCMKDVVDDEHKEAAGKFRELLAAYRDAEDLINLGAYARGSNPSIDRAIDKKEEMDAFLKQGVYEKDEFEGIHARLLGIFKKAETGVRKEFAAATPYFARQRTVR
ncbi:MAG: flagellar protein export ATPase FliI [Spirochaetes bacterium]|nr:MAG: flagellar protein export ATPase FliI [Spirochaetota bacterium]